MLSSSRLDRITEWWRPKAGVILSLLMFYMVVWDVTFSIASALILFSVITLFGFGVTGYYLNDLADLPFDRKVGKSNILEGTSIPFRVFIAIALIAITAFPWFVYLKADALSLALIGAQLLLMILYPLPPFRFKNRPLLGMVSDALYAFVVPAILAWHTMDITADYNDNPHQTTHFIALALWMFAMGIRHITNHHVFDAENDRASGTPNLAHSLAPLQLRKLIQVIIYPLELAFAIVFFVIIGLNAGFYPNLVATIVVIIGATSLGTGKFWFPISFEKIALDRFAAFGLGLLSTIVLSLGDSRFLIFTSVFILLLTDVYKHPAVVVFGTELYLIFKKTLLFPFRAASLAFNWSLYYFRKWVLKWDEPRNWGEHYSKRLTDLREEQLKKQGVVAVFNQNRNKYTETFVKGHLSDLPFWVIPFYGWPHPIHTVGMENLLSRYEFVQQSKLSIWRLMNINVRQRLDYLVVNRLNKEGVNLILAEFGPIGSRVASISEASGIPLVVIFYGYDAWHKNALEENAEGYKQLFRQASAILGVSKDICKQLVELGCPENKVQYLPCFVNLDLFQPAERDYSAKSILAVGRFCVTKSPQLTILAFNEVLKKHPDATLRMVGEDEGGGILESCKVLVQSLGISEKVDFLGSLPPEKVAEEMHRATLFVQHSLTAPETGDKEGTPVAIMEALATGLPVVATKHAGIAEMIESGKSGVLVDEFDYIRMAEEMTILFDNPESMKRIGDNAAESIRTSDLVVNHIQHLTEIIKKHQVLV